MANTRAARRQQLVQLLLQEDYQSISDLAAGTPVVVTNLLALLFDPDSLLHWRATEAIGFLAQTQPKKIKDIIPRLLWSLNEDSASFGWGAAAALGEIGRYNYSLVEDIILMLFHFLEDDFTREGMLWGLARLGQTHPQVVRQAADRIQACLTAVNPQVRAYAAWALGIIGAQAAAGALRPLLSDAAPVKIYDPNHLRDTTVGLIAAEALQRLEN